MIEGKIPELKEVPKRKFYFMEQILKTDSLSPYGMQLKVQSVVDDWIGQDHVLVEVKDEGVNILKFIIYRSYVGDYNERRFLPDGSFLFPSDADTVYEMDCKFIMGINYRAPMTGVCAYANARMFLQKSDVIKAYKKEAKLHHASAIKNMTIAEFPDRLEVTIEVK